MEINVVNRKSQCNHCKEDKEKLLDIYIGEDKGSRFRIRLCKKLLKGIYEIDKTIVSNCSA